MKREISIRETAGMRLQHSLAKLFAQRFCLDCGRRGAGETFIDDATNTDRLPKQLGRNFGNCCRSLGFVGRAVALLDCASNFIRAAVPGAAQRADRPRDTGVHVRARARDDSRGEGRGIERVFGI